MRPMKMTVLLLSFLMMLLATDDAAKGQTKSGAPGVAQLEQMARRFAPTPIRVDTAQLSAGDRQALVKLIEAARIVDEIFLRQYWSGDLALYQRLQKDTSALGRARLHYFWINKGPWSIVDDYKAFLPGVPPRKPEGSNFYPENMTKEDFQHWLSALTPEEQEQAKSFFTVIRSKTKTPKAKGYLGPAEKLRDQFVIVPYSEEYRDDLTRTSTLVHEAAGLTTNASLSRFLNARADAFLSNNYYESDLAWMDLDSPLDVTIGPYETYNDELFGYKAAFEAYINLRDDRETAKLAAFAKHLQEIEDNLPIDPKYRNPKLGAAAPIRVVDVIISAGDGNHGVQTAAYNLPNDERVVQEKGSKRVMLKNIQEAKFRSVLLPISMKVLSKTSMVDVNFDSFFTHILAHELMHGLGPQQIMVEGRQTSPRQELKELYSAIEEAKADVTSLFALQYTMDHNQKLGIGSLLPSDEAAERQLYVTFLASAFRSLRFGLNDAHGKGMAVQVNYLMDKGAFVAHGDGTFSVDMSKIKPAVRDLDHDLLTVEAEGDYEGARKLLNELGVVRPAVRRALSRLNAIPIDIEPIFVTADELAPSNAAKAAEAAPAKAKTLRKKRR